MGRDRETREYRERGLPARTRLHVALELVRTNCDRAKKTDFWEQQPAYNRDPVIMRGVNELVNRIGVDGSPSLGPPTAARVGRGAVACVRDEDGTEEQNCIVV